MLSLKEKRKKALKHRSLFLYQQFLEELALKSAQENADQNLKKEHSKVSHGIHFHFKITTQRERSCHVLQSNKPWSCHSRP